MVILNEAQLLTIPSMSSLGIVERRGELIRHNTRGLTLALTLRLSQTFRHLLPIPIMKQYG